MTIYRKTEVIQSYLRIWGRYTPIESGPPPRPPRSAPPVRFDSLKAKIGPLCTTITTISHWCHVEPNLVSGHRSLGAPAVPGANCFLPAKMIMVTKVMQYEIHIYHIYLPLQFK